MKCLPLKKVMGRILNNSRIRVSNKERLKMSLIVTGGPKQASKIKDQIFSEYIKVSKQRFKCRKFW